MSTDQNQTGRGQAANTPPQPILNAAQMQSYQYLRQRAYLLRIAENVDATNSLFTLLRAINNFEGEPDVTPVITEMFGEWIKNTNINLSQKRYQIRDFVDHIAFLISLREGYLYFDATGGFGKEIDSQFAEGVFNEE